MLKDIILFIAGQIPNAPPLRGVYINLIGYILSFTAIVGVTAFIVGGYTYLTSGGNDEKLQRGKKTIIYSIVGLAIIMISAMIVNVVISLG